MPDGWMLHEGTAEDYIAVHGRNGYWPEQTFPASPLPWHCPRQVLYRVTYRLVQLQSEHRCYHEDGRGRCRRYDTAAYRWTTPGGRAAVDYYCPTHMARLHG